MPGIPPCTPRKEGSYTTLTERNHGSRCLDKLADTSTHVSPCPKPITLHRRVRMHSRSHIPPPVIVLPAASDYRNHENMPSGRRAVTQADAMAKRACRTTRKCLYCVHRAGNKYNPDAAGMEIAARSNLIAFLVLHVEYLRVWMLHSIAPSKRIMGFVSTYVRVDTELFWARQAQSHIFYRSSCSFIPLVAFFVKSGMLCFTASWS